MGEAARERVMMEENKQAPLSVKLPWTFYLFDAAILLALVGGMFQLGRTIGSMETQITANQAAVVQELTHINKSVDDHTQILRDIGKTVDANQRDLLVKLEELKK